MSEFRRFFFRGLAALMPTLLTVALLAWAYNLVHDFFGVYITHGLKLVCQAVSPEPAPGWVDPDQDTIRYGRPINEWDEDGRRLTVEYKAIQAYSQALDAGDAAAQARAKPYRDEALWEVAFVKYRMDLLGFVIAIILVYFIGVFLASFIGRNSWRAFDGLLHRIPLIRVIYSNVKQVTDFLFTERKVEFSSIVAVEWPRKGVWSLGFMIGEPIPRVQSEVDTRLVTVFIPNSPTPLTGFAIQVPREDVIELNISIDEGLRFIISCGVIRPGASVTPEQQQALDEALKLVGRKPAQATSEKASAN